MPHAHALVGPDKTVTLVVDGDLTRHPDLGAALAHLTATARATNSPIDVEIEDGTGTRGLLVDAAGKVTAGPASAVPTTREEAGTTTAAEAGAPLLLSHPDILPDDPIDVPTSAIAQPASVPTTAPADAAPVVASDAVPDPGEEPLSTGEIPIDGRHFPRGTPFSGPADAAGSAPREEERTESAGTTPPPRKTPRSRRPWTGYTQGLKGFTAPSLVLAVLLVIVLAAYFVPSFIGNPESQAPESIPAAQGTGTSESLKFTESHTPVPGFSATPTWRSQIAADAAITANERGVAIVDGTDLTVLDPRTGRTRYSGEVPSTPSFVADTTVDGTPALVWRSGDSAWALLDGASEPVKYELPTDARVSSAGTSVLVKDGNLLFTLGGEGLVEVPTPRSGSTPMAIDGDVLISAGFAGPVTKTGLEDGSTSDLVLEQPAEGLQIIRWVTAGHGKVVTLWGEPGASTSSGHRIQLVVHSLDDGRITSTVSTTTDSVGEAEWVRGQGFDLAVIGPYLFDMRSGLLVTDGTLEDARFDAPRGLAAPAVIDEEKYLVSGGTAWKTPTNLLAMIGNFEYAVTKSSPTTITTYAGG